MPSWSAVDEGNSSTTPLGAGGTFTGTWRRVLDYVSVLVYADSNTAPASNGIQLQWGHDGLTEDSSLRQSFGNLGLAQPAIAFTRAEYFRVVYTTGSAQSTFRLRTILRRDTAHGSIGPAGEALSKEQDALLGNSVLYASNISTPSRIDHLKTGNDALSLIVETVLQRNTQSERVITAATAFSQQIDFFGLFGASRRHFSVFNDTKKGNLYLRFGGSASLSSWLIKLPPQHLWELPQAWGVWSGTIHGIWDKADGSAYTAEWF